MLDALPSEIVLAKIYGIFKVRAFVCISYVCVRHDI